ncbi:hypothetical protein DL93DRAFT_1873140 [Clavulina sp. PMI_390]|nr:hypothetical protein DL93DRAFT_1873140 [Clavulina sp. PMI_390]
MGRPYEIDTYFAVHLHLFYYIYIAPIVALWLWEVRVVRMRREVDAWFRTEVLGGANEYHLSVEDCAARAVELVYNPLEVLNQKFGRPLSEELQRLRISTSIEAFVRLVAREQPLRALARLLPSGPVIGLANIVQKVLADQNLEVNQDYHEDRPWVVKLLQELCQALPLGQLPSCFSIDPANPWAPSELPDEDGGGEAKIMWGGLAQDEAQRDSFSPPTRLAARVPKIRPSVPIKEKLLQDQVSVVCLLAPKILFRQMSH